jgi:predicted DNA-binding transcriptional regulator AlpA
MVTNNSQQGVTRVSRPKPTRKLSTRALRERYGVCDMTIKRWIESGVLPRPEMTINRLKYWDESVIEQYERDRMKAHAETAA